MHAKHKHRERIDNIIIIISRDCERVHIKIKIVRRNKWVHIYKGSIRTELDRICQCN